jgi:hypothetical protein
MTAVRTLQRAFAGGEIAPEMAGRLDIDKFQTGLKTCRNFRVLPHGPVVNRSGFEHILEAKDSANNVRIIAFSFNNEQTYVLEFGHLYVRFHTAGGTLLETGLAISGITQANPGVLTYVGADPANGDWMFLSGIGGMTALNGRFVKVANVDAGANTFELTDLGGANINTTAMGAYTAGGTTARVYTVTTPYTSDQVFDLDYTQSADIMTLVHPSHAPRELQRLGATNWQLATITFAPTITTPAAPTLTTGGPGGGTPITHTYVCTAVNDSNEESFASASANVSLDLTVAGNYIDVDPPAVSGASRFNIYKLSNGLYGYIGQTDGSAFRDTNYTADTLRTPPVGSNPFNAAGDYPAAVGYFEQRRVFAATDNRPQNVWLTRPGTESNLTTSIPVQDDDAIFYRIKAAQQNRIQYLLPLQDLLMLTNGAEWRAFTDADALTPSTLKVRAQSFVGAAQVKPLLTSTSVLFAQGRGAHIREMSYSWERNGYQANDVSLLAPHLFDAETIVDMAYQTAPYQTAWAVRGDGTLLGMTYVPEHRVYGWHQHETDGLFKSVAVVAEGSEDILYAVVARTINGRSVKLIERMKERRPDEQVYRFFVDAGDTYNGAAASTITGLWHLEGESVVALADGAVVRGLTVTNGSITLPAAASVVHVGLPITSDLETLPLTVEAAPAAGRGMVKNVNRAFLRVDKSSGIFVGPSFTKLREAKIRTTEPYGSPPSLQTREVEVPLDPTWQRDGTVCVRQADPLPLSVLGLALEVEVSG